ncbi:MAG: HD domain-containing protein [Candidatus Bathyarchaeia archaeon]
MISREEAIELVEEHVSNDNLVKHMIAVGAIMRSLAERFGEDPELWEAVGILHDIDYEEVGEELEVHGLRSAEMVEDLLPEEGIHAIKAHNAMTGVEATSRMDLSLYSADAVSGMIVANALVRPTGLKGMSPGSIKRRMNDSSFAKQISREDIRRCEDLELDLNEFLKISVEAMQSVSDEIGL